MQESVENDGCFDIVIHTEIPAKKLLRYEIEEFERRFH